MSRYTALLVTAVLSIALVATPAQALPSSDRTPHSIFAQIEGLLDLLVGRLLGSELRGANEKAGPLIDPYGHTEPNPGDLPPLDGAGPLIDPYG